MVLLPQPADRRCEVDAERDREHADDAQHEHRIHQRASGLDIFPYIQMQGSAVTRYTTGLVLCYSCLHAQRRTDSGQ